MPCYSPTDADMYRSAEAQTQRINKELKTSESKAAQYKDYSMKIDAAMCAVLNELEQIGIIESVITKASRHGLIDIVGWWESHKQDDKARLTKSLHNYSIDEQRVLFDLLKGQFDDK
jgi:hypothetical protein